MISLEVRGAEDFARLGKRLREVGNRELRKELLAGLNRAAKPAKEAVKPNIREKLPHKGGAGEFVASTLKVTQSNRSAGKNPRVTIWSKSNHNISAIDKGRLRHPIFGNKKVWSTTPVEPNTFTAPSFSEPLLPSVTVPTFPGRESTPDLITAPSS